MSDYTRTGFDRGHLAPNADMANPDSQFDSFSLANIAPQTPDNNRKTWVKIETQTRNLTNQYGSAYVVTGVAFLTPEVKRLKNRVLVPSHFFKAVYLPSQHQAMAFFSPNDDSGTVEKISLSTLKKRVVVQKTHRGQCVSQFAEQCSDYCTITTSSISKSVTKQGKKMSAFKPFQNDSQSVGLGEFTLENQGEQVNLYGSATFTLDKQSLATAKQLQDVLSQIIDERERYP